MPGERNLSFTPVRSEMALDLSLESWEGRASSLVRAWQEWSTHYTKCLSGAWGRLVWPLLNGGSGLNVSSLQ